MRGNIDKFVGRSLFSNGCIRVTDSSSITDIKGYGILVSEDATIDSFDSGDPSFEGPQNGDVLVAGFYLPIKVKSISISAGIVYIGKE